MKAENILTKECTENMRLKINAESYIFQLRDILGDRIRNFYSKVVNSKMSKGINTPVFDSGCLDTHKLIQAKILKTIKGIHDLEEELFTFLANHYDSIDDFEVN